MPPPPPQDQFRLVTQLLHDARLQALVWDRALATLTARFDCLRRSADGSDLADRTVELQLAGVCAVAVGYDPVHLDTRPSQFEPPRRIAADDLADWPFRLQEATLWINSDLAEDVLDSARLDWLAGDESQVRRSACTFCLTFDQWVDFGMPPLHVRILASGDAFSITGGGVPLDLDEWEKQFAAWWQGWRGHWAAKGDRDDEDEAPAEYETAIPAGEPEPPDLSYRPPAEPVFELEPSDVPPDLLGPIRDLFEAQHARDWARQARAFPRADLSIEEHARQLEEQSPNTFGTWGYPRCVDKWWREGRRACVIVRGVEHTMPLDGDPAQNREAVWTFALRHRHGRWVVATYSQGWASHASGDKLPARQKPWLKQWRSGPVG